MANAADSKSAVLTGLRVRLPSPALQLALPHSRQRIQPDLLVRCVHFREEPLHIALEIRKGRALGSAVEKHGQVALLELMERLGTISTSASDTSGLDTKHPDVAVRLIRQEYSALHRNVRHESLSDDRVAEGENQWISVGAQDSPFPVGYAGFPTMAKRNGLWRNASEGSIPSYAVARVSFQRRAPLDL
jgi:hypothetical protein